MGIKRRGQPRSEEFETQDLGRIVRRLDERAEETIGTSNSSEEHLVEILTGEYPNLTEKQIRVEIEQARQEGNGGNPTEYASLGEAVEDKASTLENDIIELHKTLNTEFKGEKKRTIQTSSEKYEVTYKVTSWREPEHLLIKTYKSSNSRGGHVFQVGVESTYAKEEWNPKLDFSIKDENGRTLDPSQSDKKMVKTVLKAPFYPFAKLASSIYNSFQEPEYNVRFFSDYPRQARERDIHSPTEYLNHLSKQDNQRAEIKKGILNNVKPVVHELYEEKIGNLPGTIEPEPNKV